MNRCYFEQCQKYRFLVPSTHLFNQPLLDPSPSQVGLPSLPSLPSPSFLSLLGDRPGQCPLSSIDCSSRDLKQCLQDGDCPQTVRLHHSHSPYPYNLSTNVALLDVVNDVCVSLQVDPPVRKCPLIDHLNEYSACVHFSSALIRIPNGRSNKIVVPSCDSNGDFEEVHSFLIAILPSSLSSDPM